MEENQKKIRVVEIGIWIDSEHHKKGYGSAAEIFTDYGFYELKYYNILARACENNEGSNKTWRRLCFKE